MFCICSFICDAVVRCVVCSIAHDNVFEGAEKLTHGPACTPWGIHQRHLVQSAVSLNDVCLFNHAVEKDTAALLPNQQQHKVGSGLCWTW